MKQSRTGFLVVSCYGTVIIRRSARKSYYHFVINDDLEKAIETCDKIAHNHDEFNSVDDAVRSIARDLAADLRQKIYETAT